MSRPAMPEPARLQFEKDLGLGRLTDDTDRAWAALTRAHILSQRWAVPHLRCHAAMLTRAVRERQGREMFGQIVRLIVAAPGSWSGRVPVGNTGRSDVPLMQPMPVPDDLAALLELTSGAG